MTPDTFDIQQTTLFRHVFCENDSNGFFYFGYRLYENTTTSLPDSAPLCYHFYVVLSGSGFLTDTQGKSWPLSSATCFQLPPNATLSLMISPDAPFLVYEICLGANAFLALCDIRLIDSADTVFPLDFPPHLKTWMNHALYDALENRPDTTETYFNLQKLLINLHQQNRMNSSRTLISKLEGAKQLLCNDYQNPISLKEIAKTLDMSYELFRKVFKDEVGLSPLQFRLQCKFYYAQNLLSAGNSIQETALAVGYLDSFTFSRQFKKYTGHPPSYYKNKTGRY